MKLGDDTVFLTWPQTSAISKDFYNVFNFLEPSVSNFSYQFLEKLSWWHCKWIENESISKFSKWLRKNCNKGCKSTNFQN